MKTISRIHLKYVVWLVLVSLCAAGCGQTRRNVVLTGYWPVTNEMLREFCDDPVINPNGWKGSNWKSMGYDVYAFFPTFPANPYQNPKGNGVLEVDYQDTFADFEAIVAKYKPIAIVCYGMGQGPWEIERRAIVRDRWSPDFLDPKLPDKKSLETMAVTGKTYSTTLPAEQIELAVNRAGLGVKAWIDEEGDPGDFLCNYIACLAMGYQKRYENRSKASYCISAGFIHVGPGVSLEQARKAQELTLEAVLKSTVIQIK
ncbi:MAG TPA: hypothetical protein PKB02_01295 [Anaerohalosphaeraceae bacterium]|nr:hypothetical protein [Anaerohalosphaeraceae bacterium]